MKKTICRTLKIFMLLTVFMALCTVSVSAAEDDGRKQITGTFSFGAYVPELEIHNAAMPDRALTAKADGSLVWQKAVPGKWEQSWMILPANKAGYYIIQEFTNEHSQRVVTYTAQGFRLEYPSRETGPSSAQMFRFKWHATYKAGGRTLKNVWTLVNAENSICLCTKGWACFDIYQTNWSEYY